MANALDVFLMQVKQGGAKIPELARQLGATKGATFLYTPETSVAVLQCRAGAVAPVTLSDRTGQPLACLFSHRDHVDAFAKANGITADGSEIYTTRVTPWASALHEVLVHDYVGMMIDFGQPHSLGFNDGQVRKVYAYLLWDQHLSSPTVHVLWRGDGPYVLRAPQGTQMSVAFDDAAAHAMVATFRARGEPDMIARSLPLREGLRLLWDANATQIVVNNELPDWHVYAREELQSMLGSLPMEPDRSG